MKTQLKNSISDVKYKWDKLMIKYEYEKVYMNMYMKKATKLVDRINGLGYQLISSFTCN